MPPHPRWRGELCSADRNMSLFEPGRCLIWQSVPGPVSGQPALIFGCADVINPNPALQVLTPYLQFLCARTFEAAAAVTRPCSIWCRGLLGSQTSSRYVASATAFRISKGTAALSSIQVVKAARPLDCLPRSSYICIYI